MANTSCDQAARELLCHCLRGDPWPRSLLLGLIGDDCSRDLFRVVAEGLADRFEPALCDTYAELFSEALAAIEPELEARALLARAGRVLFNGVPTGVDVNGRAGVAYRAIFFSSVRPV